MSKMGNPRLLADEFLDKKAYLIGPRYYPTYLMISKIVSGAVALGITIAFTAQYLFSADASIFNTILQWLGSTFMGVIQAIAWVTVIFALVERYETPGTVKDMGLIDPKVDDWSVNDLPKSQRSVNKSDRIEGLVGFIFAVILLLLLNTHLEIFGAYMFDNGVLREIVPIFNIQNASTWLPLLSIAIALNGISDGLAMAIRNQTKNTMWIRLSMNLVSLILFAYVLFNGNIFNAQLAFQIAPNSSELNNLWIMVQRNVVVVVIIANLISMSIQSYQIFKFNKA
ncbi:MAG: hypothetical protein KMY54_01310 [Erysipelothrix sp.]|nr:hypothetical protein [Erysipelothrix sp.]